MFRAPIIAALTLFAAMPALSSAAAGSAPLAAEPSYGRIEAIDWTYRVDDKAGHALQLRLSRHGMTTSFGPDEAAAIIGQSPTASLARPGEAINFTLTREAGVLTCSGHSGERGNAAGTCRFDPDLRFTAGLARRGLTAQDSEQVLALALVDARIEQVDGLSGQGYRFDAANDLVAVAALGVSPGYASALREAGLQVDKLNDLVAARALKIDVAWLSDMARAGYPGLDVHRAIEMRALGVTPDYARRMTRVLNAVSPLE